MGVVGVGIAGSSHLFDLASNEQFTIAAVCGRRPDRVAAAADLYGASRIYDDPAAMIRTARLDGIVIATPPDVSPPVLAMSLQAGLPTLIEKPGARTAAALDQVAHQAGPAAALAVVAYNRRYQHHVRYARHLLRSDGIGPLTHVDCRWVGPFTRRYASNETYRIGVQRGDGVLLDTASHIVDTLMYLGIGSLVVRRARLDSGPTGADVAARLELYSSSHCLPVSVRIEDRDSLSEDSWTMTVRGMRGNFRLDRVELTAHGEGGLMAVAASDLRRPVDDLLDAAVGQSALGASMTQASAVLAVIDQVRDVAESRRPWLRPRAKALGRLNGAC
ncbi:MAG TPA: Gfo/Idh/MocA family oxidoreductase [Micromonosporaceae bacterium]|nr:Gfo/Idh/MocA family oxidoreductase [Micromonosporaceae bacterium]